MSKAIFWDHVVGSAGIETENRYNVFYRTEPCGPMFYVPIVAGTHVGDAIDAVRKEFRPLEIIVDHRGEEPYWETVDYDEEDYADLDV